MTSGTVFESPRPLSESGLWRAQHDFYEGAGISAWATGEVPHTLTSGPLLARAYAEIVTGYLLDTSAGDLGPQDLDEPIYILELGAGTGRLAFHFLRALDRCQQSDRKVVYVLTDAVDANVQFWLGHPRLRPYLQDGRLECARFDAVADREFTLEVSGKVIRAGSLANPLIVLANYLFDVIPQDLFACDQGDLFEDLIALVSTTGTLSYSSPDFFSDVWLATERVPVAPGRYSDPELDELLRGVADEPSRSGTSFLFPATSLSCLSRLAEMCDSRMLLITGERPGGLPERPIVDFADSNIGVLEDEARRPGAVLGMGVHGASCSLPVDLAIVSRFFEQRDGTTFLPSASPAGLIVAAFSLGAQGPLVTLHQRFHAHIDEGGPEDVYLSLRATLDVGVTELPLALALALLRVSGFDPYLLRELYPSFEKQLPRAVSAGAEEAFRVLSEVAAREYPIDDKTDIGFGAALLFAKSERYKEALTMLRSSRALHGPRPHSAFNEALCLLHLGQAEPALTALDEALVLDPRMDAARELRDEVRKRLTAGEEPIS